jgi:hypothetical protein
MIPFERIPSVVIGKLLERQLPCNCHLGPDHDGLLALFVTPIGTLEPIDDRFPPMVREVLAASSEFFKFYPELARLTVNAEGNASQLHRWGKHRVARVSAQDAISQVWEGQSLTWMDEGTYYLPSAVVPPSWTSLHSGKPVDFPDLGPVPDGYWQVPHLDSLPWILVGSMRARGLAVDEAYIYRDAERMLTLCFSFPIGLIEERDEAHETETILGIATGARLALAHYPELCRLAIWSRPDLADKIAIPQFWFSREDVLRYCNGEVPATEFLNLRTDVTYPAHEPPGSTG